MKNKNKKASTSETQLPNNLVIGLENDIFPHRFVATTNRGVDIRKLLRSKIFLR